jgi:hypothetical protein
MVQAITKMGTVTNAQEEAEKCMQVQQLFSNIVAKNNHGQAKMYSPDLSL